MRGLAGKSDSPIITDAPVDHHAPAPARTNSACTHVDAFATAAGPAKLALLQLPSDVLVNVFCWLDGRSLARVAATCVFLNTPARLNPIEEALRQRAAMRGRVCPDRMLQCFSSWTAHLSWLDHRCDEAWVPVAARTVSVFVADGRLMSCGSETEYIRGVLGHGKRNDQDRIIRAPTPLQSMAGVRIRSVAAGCGFNASVSAAGTVHTWGVGDFGCLGHGDEEDSLVPKQVHALSGHRVLSVATGFGHCLAVTERGEVFSWGFGRNGQCGHGQSRGNQKLPRRVDALTGVRVRSASTGDSHSLVVTEEGGMYSFGYGLFLGHGGSENDGFPKILDALSHVRIKASAAGSAHSIALTDDGTVFLWGGALMGVGGIHTIHPLPQLVDALCGLTVCAVDAVALTSFAVTVEGELFTWGYGRFGQLGHGNCTDPHGGPRRVKALDGEWVIAVSAGKSHTIAVTRGGSVFGWGEASALGLPDTATTISRGIRSVWSPVRYLDLHCDCDRFQ